MRLATRTFDDLSALPFMREVITSLIMLTVLGCSGSRNPDYHFSQSKLLGATRDHIFDRLSRYTVENKNELDLVFILPSGRRVPYLNERSIQRILDQNIGTQDELRELGYLDGSVLPKAYWDSESWTCRWYIGGGPSYQYFFDKKGHVAKIVVSYPSEGLSVLGICVGFYWIGTVFSFVALLCRGRVSGKGASHFFVVAFRDGVLATLTGMVAVWLTSLIFDPEIVLAISLLTVPLLASMTIYYITLFLSGSGSLAFCGFFTLPLLGILLLVVEAIQSSQTLI